MKRWRRILKGPGLGRTLAAVVLVALLAIRVADPSPVEELRVRTFDTFQLIQPRELSEQPVIIVDIDEKSLGKFGQWPWPRNLIADLVSKLSELGAVAIAFDVMFPEPDRLSPGIAFEHHRSLDDVTRARLRSLPSNDQVLADALRSSQVVLGASGLPATAAVNEQAPVLRGTATLGVDPVPFLVDFPGLLRNIPVLEKAASGIGLITIRTERDGIVRRVPLVMQAQGLILPSLAFEMLRVATQSDAIIVRSDQAGIRSVGVRGFELPTDRNGQLWVHFSHHDKDRFVSAADVLDGRVGSASIGGKLVLIGTSAVGLLDTKTTPVEPVMPGVEIHAQVLESVLSHSMLSRPRYAIMIELLMALVIGGAIIWLLPILGPFVILVVGGVIASMLVGASWYLYARQHLLIDFTFPLASSLSLYTVLVFTNYVTEQTRRRQIRQAFGQYLSPSLVEQLANAPERLVLGGEQRNVSIMFSDVRGFTAISERYKDDPQGLIALMNRLLTPLTNAIMDRRGTIDKYMGDAIMAFWNAPLDDPQHEINACHAALDMLERLESLNRERQREAQENETPFFPIRIGVGLNTGVCVVGNMGSDLHFDYSVMGDSVNVASRLEGQSKLYGIPVIAGSRTATAARDHFALVELDFVTVKGKTEPELIYAVMGRGDLASSSRFQELRTANIEMLALYRCRRWDDALAVISRARCLDETRLMQRYYDLYVDRIEDFRSNPPPEGWNGAYAMETK